MTDGSIYNVIALSVLKFNLIFSLGIKKANIKFAFFIIKPFSFNARLSFCDEIMDQVCHKRPGSYLRR